MGAQLLALTLFAHPPVTPGDIDPAGFTRSSCGLNPYANDVLGHTDKLNSHAIQIGCGGSAQTLSSVVFGETTEPEQLASPEPGFYTGLTWRLFTPIWADQHGGKRREQPVGSYADWLEWQTAVAHSWHVVYLQGSVSLHHIGPKGGAEIMQGTHKLLGLREVHWSSDRQETVMGGSAESGFVWAIIPRGQWTRVEELRAGLGWSDSPLLREPYISMRMQGALPRGMKWNGSLHFGWPETGSLALVPVARAHKPLHSIGRVSTSWTLRHLSHLFSAFTLSSPYVASDRFRQVVVTPLGLVFDW